MTLPFDVDQAAQAARKEARKLCGRGKAVNRSKTPDFRQKSPESVLKAVMRHLLRLFAAASLVVLAACASKPRPAMTLSPTPKSVVQPPAPSTALPVAGGNENFQAFVRDFQATALARGVTAETYAKAMTGIAPLTTLSTIIAEQPEFVRPVWAYLDGTVSARRIADAKLLLNQNAALLADIETRYGVPREILVAIWGMETDYGRDEGSYNLFASLATQAYDGPRQGFAQRELIAALLLLQQNNYVPSEMVSSWAGAFGQTQFMPSTFFKYATDGDGDGKIDLWHSTADALASTALLFQREGWQAGKPWGYEVSLPKDFAYQDADLGTLKPLSEWASRGVKLVSGGALPEGDETAALYLPAGANGPALLTMNNFRQIMKYNNAASYALAVSMLAERMMDRPGIQTAWPRSEKLLSRADRLRFQTDLAALGYDAGELDGLLGRKTRTALRQYQATHGLVADAYPTQAMLSLLDTDATRATTKTD
jgi:membrane-bound lytic murein transglycosylase B